MSSLRIAIIGAGPAGCTLARLLVLNDISVTVFEGEASPDVRSQGGSLDLHTDTGLAALKEAGLYDEFLKYARFDGEAMTVADKKLVKYVNMGGTTAKGSRGRPEIDRVNLRLLLLKSLPDNVIRWNHRLRKVDDDLSLHFDHGTERGFDLVVGADGAWSKVRPLLTDVKPFYAGIGGATFSIPNAEERYPDLHKLVNRGLLMSFSDGKSLGGQQVGDGSISVNAWSVRQEDWMETSAHDIHDPKAVKEALAKEYHDWAPELRKLIQVASEDDVTQRSLYMLPVGHRWENRQGVTLLGDSAHLMTPFAGEGVNVAMKDAMNLASSIIEAKKSGDKRFLKETVKAFEEEMFTRAAVVQELTRASMEDMYMVEGAPRTVIERWIYRVAADSMNRYIAAFCIKPLIYIYFWWFKLFH